MIILYSHENLIFSHKLLKIGLNYGRYHIKTKIHITKLSKNFNSLTFASTHFHMWHISIAVLLVLKQTKKNGTLDKHK